MGVAPWCASSFCSHPPAPVPLCSGAEPVGQLPCVLRPPLRVEAPSQGTSSWPCDKHAVWRNSGRASTACAALQPPCTPLASALNRCGPHLLARSPHCASPPLIRIAHSPQLCAPLPLVCIAHSSHSGSRVQESPCGHFMHSHCFAAYTRYSYTCPVCFKSLGDMSVYWKMIDSLLAAGK